MTLTHQQAQEFLQLAADGLLDANALEQLQAHLDSCHECRQYADELTELELQLARSLRARWPSLRPNDRAVQRGIDEIQIRVGRRHWVQRLYESAGTVAWAALIVALVVLMAWLFRMVTPQIAATPGDSLTDTPMPATAQPILEILTPTPKPVSGDERSLTICSGAEPDTLYLYGGGSLAASDVHEAIYDGPIDNRTFSHQPVILEKLPSLEDGDVVTKTLAVEAGDLVVDSTGAPVTLADGILVRPTGCYTTECAVAFDGTPLEMEQMVVTFRLKPGIFWSDGTPLTAHDSVYSFELDKDPDTPSDKNLVDRTARYEALDPLTTAWTGLPGYRDSTFLTNFWTPLPEHAWSALTALELTQAEESTRLPMGWGPYVIKEWVAGEHITLAKNEYYWRADEGLPKVDSIIFRFVGENPNATIAALLSGDCDIAGQTTQLDGQVGMLLELQSVGKLAVTTAKGTVWEHLDFGINPIESYDRPGYFSDVRVRQAIAYCLDRQSVVDAVLYGQSQVLHSYVPPEHPLNNPDVEQYPFDPQRGARLLDAVGWVDEDGDPDTPRVAQGIEGVPDGTKLSFNYWTTSANERQAATRILESSLAECGIDVRLEFWSPSEFFSNAPDGPVFGRHFVVAQFAWLTEVTPPCELYLSQEITGDPEAGFCGWGCVNNTGFANSEYDAACKSALSSLPGTPAYEDFHKEAQRIFAEQLPVIPLYLSLKLAAARPDLKGFEMDPTAKSEFYNIEAFDFGE
jgi:peptide/nickel transport system substrate-binding protein